MNQEMLLDVQKLDSTEFRVKNSLENSPPYEENDQSPGYDEEVEIGDDML